MSATTAKSASPVLLLHGDDDSALKLRAKTVYEKWCTELGGMDHEIIDANAGNADEVLKAIARLREALQTLPFFGGGKAIWWRDCSFLGDNRSGAAKIVTETLAEVAQELKEFSWQNVRLLITAAEVDRRKTLFKTIEKIGAVEVFAELSVDDRNWAGQAEQLVLRAFRARHKEVSDEALSELVERIGPHSRVLANEVEKVSLYVGSRPKVALADVDAVCTRQKTARAFALADALGNRDLPGALRALDEELWEIRAKTDRDKSEIGLLYGLISKVRAMIFLKEILAEGWVRPSISYDQLKSQLPEIAKAHAAELPTDKKFNPLALNPFVLYKALSQSTKYSRAELVVAMEVLLQCNRQLVTSGLDAALILQQALVRIIGRAAAPDAAGRKRG